VGPTAEHRERVPRGLRRGETAPGLRPDRGRARAVRGGVRMRGGARPAINPATVRTHF